MFRYIHIDENGLVIYVANLATPEMAEEIVQNGQKLVEIESELTDREIHDHYYDFGSNSLVAKPTKPDGEYRFDGKTKQWKLDIEGVTKAALDKRQRLLAQSDYTQLPDVTIANRQEWAAYRQELRDITTQANWPILVTWPTPPAN